MTAPYWVSVLAAIALAGCADTLPSGASSDENSIPAAEANIATIDIAAPEPFDSENALDEIVSLTNVCRSIVSKAVQPTSQELATVLEQSGYSPDPEAVQGLSAARTQTVEYFKKDAFDTLFVVTWGSNRTGCVALIGDFAGTPTIDDVQDAFLNQDWQKSGIVGSATQEPERAVMSKDDLGNSIVAILSENPDPGSNIAVGISVSYVES